VRSHGNQSQIISEDKQKLSKSNSEIKLLFGRENPVWMPFSNISNWFLHPQGFELLPQPRTTE
jgi:hypothetical protein